MGGSSVFLTELNADRKWSQNVELSKYLLQDYRKNNADKQVALQEYDFVISERSNRYTVASN